MQSAHKYFPEQELNRKFQFPWMGNRVFDVYRYLQYCNYCIHTESYEYAEKWGIYMYYLLVNIVQVRVL